MKKDISYYIKCIATTLIIFFEFGSVYGSVDLIVEPDQIYFNYEEGNTNDALTLRDNNGVVITESEWDSYDLGRHKFAYIKGQTNRKIKVQFYSNYQGIMHLQIKLSYVPGYSDGIGTVCNFFVSNFDNSPSSPSTLILPLTGTLPDSVGAHSFRWHWEIYAIPVNNSNYCADWTTTETSHHFYTLLAAPQAPVSEPWTSVLDLACAWAANNTTEQQVLSSITTNAYNYFGQTKEYAGDVTHTNGSTFSLTGFFSGPYVDCQDMSAVVQVFTWMLGGTQTRVLTINDKRYGIEDFYYKKIKPIGLDWIENGNWNFHQVGWLNNVYDACIKLNYNNERIPVNEDVSGSYKNDLYIYNYYYPWVPKTDSTFYFEVVY